MKIQKSFILLAGETWCLQEIEIYEIYLLRFFSFFVITQPAITYLNLTIETLEQGVKYVQS